MTPALPPGWRVELLGLIGGVEFTHTSGRGLLWCDGRWSMTTHGITTTAPGVPVARSMSEARRVGTAFLQEAAA